MRRAVIGVLTPLAAGPFFGQTLVGIAGAVRRAGASTLVIQTVDARVGEAHIDIPDMEAAVGWNQVDGFVVVSNAVGPEYLRRLREAGKPVAIVCSEADGFPCPTVGPDNAGGVRAAVADLVAHGHRRVAFVGNLGNNDFRERFQAYRDALLEAGIQPDDDLYYSTAGYIDVDGAAAAREMLAAGLPSTAVVAGNDQLAFGILATLTEAGCTLPEDQAVVGFDDTETSAAVQLSTVTQHVDQLGARAAELVLAALAGEDIGTGAHRIPTTYVPRRTCGCSGGIRPPANALAAATPVEAFRGVLTPSLSTTVDDGTAVSALAWIYDRVARRPGPTGSAVPSEPTTDALDDAVCEVYRFHPRPETIDLIMSAAQAYRRVAVTAGADPGPPSQDALDEAERRLVSALTRTISRRTQDLTARLQLMVRHGFDLSLELLRGHSDGSESLTWLDRTNVRVGAVGLWQDDTETLDLVSVFGADIDVLTDARTVAVRDFPPRFVLDAASGTPDLTFCLPLRTWTNNWGLLCLVGPIEADTPTGRETYFQWASLLVMALDQKAMLRSLHDRQADLTAAYRREQRLLRNVRLSEERYALAAEAANDGLWDWDLQSDEIYYAPRWKTLLGYPPGALGHTPQEWFSRVHPDDLPVLRAAVETSREHSLPLEHEHRMRTRNGDYRWMLARALAVPGPDGTAVRIVGSLTDVTEPRQLEERLRQQAMYDTLTGLPNRTLFFDRLDRAIANLSRHPDLGFAVLFLDLDGFKIVNDSLGHPTGDLLLVQVADRLRYHLRTADTAARLGGDEFAVLLSDVSGGNDVVQSARRIQEYLGEPYDLRGHQVVVSASIGVATSTPDYSRAEELVRDADIAMYRAKGRERGGFALFDPSMHEGAVARLRIESELRHAIDHDELAAFYQPIVYLDSGRVHALEALVRWRHPARGLVTPGDFLPVAEETGLIVPLGRKVWRDVCGDLVRWRAEGVLPETARVSVNVSNCEFWHGDLLETLDRTLAAHGVPAEWLTLEITEGVVMGNADQAIRVLEQLNARGFHLHIDDFGTGYSSLEALHRFPIHALKIDRSFVMRLQDERSSRELVRTIVEMGRNLGVEVITEGVETPRHREILQDVGCCYAQGYWFARPADAAGTEEYLLRQPTPTGTTP
jgi:diguanylate cyclase (GGDEF)-like protein/PAS domain S-box-containing protein